MSVCGSVGLHGGFIAKFKPLDISLSRRIKYVFSGPHSLQPQMTSPAICEPKAGGGPKQNTPTRPQQPPPVKTGIR